MQTLNELVSYMKNLGTVGQVSDWKWHFLNSLTQIRQILQDPASYEAIEAAWPLVPHKNEMAEILLQAGGLQLAQRWYYTKETDPHYKARHWLRAHLNEWPGFDSKIKEFILHESCDEFVKQLLSVDIWQELTDDQKNIFIIRLFERHPGELFKAMERYMRFIDEMRYELHDRHHYRLRYAHHMAVPKLTCVRGYVPAPEIDRVRFVIEDAGDAKYLARVNDMISQRQQAAESIVIPDIGLLQQCVFQQRVAYSPGADERELIARLLAKAIDQGYSPAALPPIYVSTEVPPLFVAYPELEQKNPSRWEEHEHRVPPNRDRRTPETMDIEQVLGVYQPRQQQIIIYARGIEWCAEKLQLDGEWLFAVVLIHELSHWLTHQLPRPGIPAWPTELYMLAETDLHEGWAQLMTWWVASELGGSFLTTFKTLNRRQSPPYLVYEEFINLPESNVMASLEKLRLLHWPARLEDWKSLLG